MDDNEIKKILEESKVDDEPFLLNSSDNKPDNKPQPKQPEVIPPINKPEDLTPEPLEPPEEEDETEEEKVSMPRTLFNELIKPVDFFTCSGCGLKVVPHGATECPYCDKPHKKWNDIKVELKIEEELSKVKSLPPKKLTDEEFITEFYRESDEQEKRKAERQIAKLKMEEELRISKFKKCTFCGEQVLTHRFIECPECGKREKTPDELELERKDRLLKCPKCKGKTLEKRYDKCLRCKHKELTHKEIKIIEDRQAKRWAEEPLTCFREQCEQNEEISNMIINSMLK